MGKHYEQLTAEERAAIMMMKADNCSARQIAVRLRRAPSTITRELMRFGSWPDRPASMANSPAAYDARAASLRARRARFKCRKGSKLASDTVLFGVVHHFLAQGWLPAYFGECDRSFRLIVTGGLRGDFSAVSAT